MRERARGEEGPTWVYAVSINCRRVVCAVFALRCRWFFNKLQKQKTKTLEIVTSRSPWAHLPPSVKGRETPTEVRDRRAVVLTERETEGFDGEARRGMRGYEG